MYDIRPAEGVQLSMTYDRRGRQWRISVLPQASHRPLLLFPHEQMINQLWTEHAPGRGQLSTMDDVREPRVQFSALVGRGSRAKQREAFLASLVKKSAIARPSTGGGPGPL